MFITVGIVTTLAFAGYFGYKNKDQVLWNSIKLYSSIKEYCTPFQCNFKLDNITVYNGKYYLPISTQSWKKLNILLLGFCNNDLPESINSEIAVSYTLNGIKYCKIYKLSSDHKEAQTIINDIEILEQYNKRKKNTIEKPINYILGASHFNGTEDIDITELLQIFDVNGTFYETNDKLNFMNILKWNDKLKLCNLHNKEVCPGMIQFIELINIYGDIKKFDINDILKF
jgi:hypothetical protein